MLRSGAFCFATSCSALLCYVPCRFAMLRVVPFCYATFRAVFYATFRFASLRSVPFRFVSRWQQQQSHILHQHHSQSPHVSDNTISTTGNTNNSQPAQIITYTHGQSVSLGRDGGHGELGLSCGGTATNSGVDSVDLVENSNPGRERSPLSMAEGGADGKARVGTARTAVPDQKVRGSGCPHQWP